MSDDLKSRLDAYAREAGFERMGVCKPDAIPEAAGRLAAFVEAGWPAHYADLDF